MDDSRAYVLLPDTVPDRDSLTAEELEKIEASVRQARPFGYQTILDKLARARRADG